MNKWSRQWGIYAEVPGMSQCNQKSPALSTWTKEEEDWTEGRMMLSRLIKNPAQLFLVFQLLKVDSNLCKFPTWDARGGWGSDGVHDRNGGEWVYVLDEAFK